jgi:hypothetical protein
MTKMIITRSQNIASKFSDFLVVILEDNLIKMIIYVVMISQI